MTPKKIAFICSASPYGTSKAREGVDAILATSAFDQDISVIFTGEGVFQLLTEQNAQNIGQKNLSSNLQALEMFGVDQIYVRQSALTERGLSPEQLCLSAETLDDKTLAQLIDEQDQCISF